MKSTRSDRGLDRDEPDLRAHPGGRAGADAGLVRDPDPLGRAVHQRRRGASPRSSRCAWQVGRSCFGPDSRCRQGADSGTMDCDRADPAMCRRKALDPQQFKVDPRTDMRQNLDEGTPDGRGGMELSWMWDVTPRATGALTLRLEIQPVVVLGDQVVEKLGSAEQADRDRRPGAPEPHSSSTRSSQRPIGSSR